MREARRPAPRRPSADSWVSSTPSTVEEPSSAADWSATTLWGRPYLLEKVAGISLEGVGRCLLPDEHRHDRVAVRTRRRGNPADCDSVDASESPTARRGVRGDARPALAHLGPLLGGRLHRPLAGRATRDAVLGIEAVPAAVEDARENARRNGIENAFFVEGDVRQGAARSGRRGPRAARSRSRRPDVIIVDPPRAGLTDKAIARIGEVAAPRIVYVSCNPATMGPNVARLQDYGYRLERVTPVDMFPHTPHVECVGLRDARSLSRARDPSDV